jgi:hypothetical protein
MNLIMDEEFDSQSYAELLKRKKNELKSMVMDIRFSAYSVKLSNL